MFYLFLQEEACSGNFKFIQLSKITRGKPNLISVSFLKCFLLLACSAASQDTITSFTERREHARIWEENCKSIFLKSPQLCFNPYLANAAQNIFPAIMFRTSPSHFVQVREKRRRGMCDFASLLNALKCSYYYSKPG